LGNKSTVIVFPPPPPAALFPSLEDPLPHPVRTNANPIAKPVHFKFEFIVSLLTAIMHQPEDPRASRRIETIADMTSISSLLVVLAVCASACPQDRLEGMARFDRYERLRRSLAKAVDRKDFPKLKWADDSLSFSYVVDKKQFDYVLAEGESKQVPLQKEPRQQPFRRPPARGRQFDVAYSVDGTMKAYTKDRNVFISKANGSRVVQLTKDGNAEKRLKFGVASWVYGEELGVREAMFWSPDGKMLAYYGFDEAKVPDYYIATDQTKIHDALDVEAYPKAGDPNPVVDLYVYHLDSKRTTKLDVRFDSGGSPGLAEYVYNVQWSPDGKELLFNRTNRKQCTMEFVAANPKTGKCRVIVREEHPATWTENTPPLWWVENKDGKKDKFVWISDRNGYRNLYLVDLDGSHVQPLTQHSYEVQTVVKIDPQKNVIFYTARSADNPYFMQLHRVSLDGQDDQRLTDPAFSHTVNISPDGETIMDTCETVNLPPVTQQLDAHGKVIKEISMADRSALDEKGFEPAERLVFPAADGKTQLYGVLIKPPHFDPAKKYPLIVNVYAGPESGTSQERFMSPHGMSALGFLVASFDGRGTSGRGKAFLDEIYDKLGTVEIDDQAAGVKYLRTRPYVDGTRVGITGTSYGGYASIMCLLRYPDVFQAAVACSSVTQWENYDTVYTERYMNTPQEDPDGYKAGSSLTYVDNLKGRLLLYYGTLDNNVHPSNTLQLIQALHRAGKRFEVMVAPDAGHVGLDPTRTWAFFSDAFMVARNPDALKTVWNRAKYARRSVAMK
jgi:dipeptidyl-peptidase-4